MKTIDGDALIKKAYDEAKGMAEPYDDFGVLVEWLIDKTPPIESEPKWIPCSERLPRAREMVIVSVRDETGDTSYDYTSHGWMTTDKEYWIVDDEINNYVIAWIPLPEPYREEGD